MKFSIEKSDEAKATQSLERVVFEIKMKFSIEKSDEAIRAKSRNRLFWIFFVLTFLSTSKPLMLQVSDPSRLKVLITIKTF